MRLPSHRATTGAAVALAAALALTGCSQKTAGGTAADASSGGTADELAIVADVQIDTTGAEVAADGAGEPADPAGDGSAVCDPVTIALAGALTGPNAALGQNILYGAQVALEKHNEANADCQVAITPFDTEGDPQKATQVAPQIVGDESVIGLLGPAFSGETKATGDVFHQAGLLSLSASATNPDLTTNGWDTFYRGLANDAVQGPAVARYMVDTLGYEAVCVVSDNSDYGIGLAEEIVGGLGDAADESCSTEVKTGDKDFAAGVQLISGSEADAVFFAGYYAEAAPFVQQLRDAGVETPLVSADGVNDPQFVSQAGSSSEGAVLSCPCGPAPEEFAAEYEEMHGQAPGVYSTEGYDLMTILLRGVDSGATDRASLLEFVAGYEGEGLARSYMWDDTGELSDALIWIYSVK
ncbi:branched-chain amino acid ABC transporter substrate-binding protein [Sanguibacter suaedae]|uniref:Branched-chain amino acid ABC transporter substrate-binding protein n=1 Tax=Sanguibacter suaedae TaxID=2795737 RepID=A0A934I2H5_9MICO|nr:branched-chain amino acid ABC transporter substrate-binding protein [Sanguibacter suaedae]MBI9114003.1 branched-chain amino acid ABC transporter substrate-binding protein [Sanguibacter suaedae]